MKQDTLIAEPTTAQIIVSQVVGTGRSGYTGVVIPTTLRLPAYLMAHADELAHRAKISRNYMLSQLVEAGIDAVFAQLSDDELREIHDGSARRVSDFIPSAETGSEGSM